MRAEHNPKMGVASSAARWQVEISVVARDYLDACHPEKVVRDRIKARFFQVFERLETYGPTIGLPHVRHIRNHLSEARVDDPTGAYRLFFGIAPHGVIAVACGHTKKADRFPPRVYDWAEKEVNAYLAQLQPIRTRTPDRGTDKS